MVGWGRIYSDFSTKPPKNSHRSLARQSGARAYGRVQLPSAPSPFAHGILITARSDARTRQPVSWLPKCWQSDSSDVLEQHGVAPCCSSDCLPVWSACGVRLAELLSELLVQMLIVSMEAVSVLEHVLLTFLHIEVVCAGERFRRKALWHKKESIFMHFFKVQPQV